MVKKLALVAVLFIGASCANTSTTPVAAPTVPTASQSSWVADAIGATPDVSLFVRPTAARGDTYWGPLVARLLSDRDHEGDFISHGSGISVLNARQIDMHFIVRDPLGSRHAKGDASAIGWVGVLYGLAPLDPSSLRSGGGTPLFGAPQRLASGVTMYPPDTEYAREYGVLAPTLFFTADGTAIVTEQVSAKRARDFLALNGAAPTPLQAGPDALAGVTFGVTSLRFLNADRNDRAAMLQGVVDAGFGLRGGRNGAVEGYADYATPDDAARGYKALERECAEANKCLWGRSWFRDAKAERDDHRMLVTLTFSDALLNSLPHAADGR